MLTKRLVFSWIFLAGAGLAAAQQATQQAVVVENSVPLFEHFLTDLASSSGAFQQAYLDHHGLTGLDRQTAVSVAAAFGTQELVLRQQANAALAAKNPGGLAQVRSQRAQLIINAGTQLMQQLSADGVSKFSVIVQGVQSRIPRRATN